MWQYLIDGWLHLKKGKKNAMYKRDKENTTKSSSIWVMGLWAFSTPFSFSPDFTNV